MTTEVFELREETDRLVREYVGPRSTEVNYHQASHSLLSERCGSIERLNRGISEDGSIRYDRPSVALDAARGNPRVLAGYRRLHSDMTHQAPTNRTWSFVIGVVYAVFCLAVAAASSGYRYDVKNDSYGFRALLEGTSLLSSVTFIASLGLVYGVIEGRRSFVSAWLVLQIVVPLYTACFYMWAIFASGDSTDFGPVRTAVPYVAMIAAIQIIAMVFCTLVVNKYYTYLKIRDSLNKYEEAQYQTSK